MVLVHSPSPQCHLSINKVSLQSLLYFHRYHPDRQQLWKMVKGRYLNKCILYICFPFGEHKKYNIGNRCIMPACEIQMMTNIYLIIHSTNFNQTSHGHLWYFHAAMIQYTNITLFLWQQIDWYNITEGN